MTKQQSSTYDIAITGGGLAGLSLAILLGQQGRQVVCIDREKADTQTDKNYDIRTTAISWGSRNLLINAGIWQDLEQRAEPIQDIVILDEDSPVELVFHNDEIEADAFGWIVDNRDLRQTLMAHVAKNKNITHMTGTGVKGFNTESTSVTVALDNGETLSAALVVGADGRNSVTREAMGIGTWSRDYHQSAVVCLIEHDKPHNGVALEHFRAAGPFAVLPFLDDDQGSHHSAVVWTVPTEEAQGWVQCSEDVFNAAIQTRCEDRYGLIKVKGSRAAWPLSLKKAYSYIAPRMVLVAEAAHGIHPIAGQGLNMSLRDIAALVTCLEGVDDVGDTNILKAYQSQRRADNLGMAVATDGLNGLFGHSLPPIRAARRFGLHAVSRLPFAKKFFMRQAMGALGHLPQLIRDAA